MEYKRSAVNLKGERIEGTKDRPYGIEEKKAERIVVICVALALIGLGVSNIPCVSRYLFGVSCPGCGMTRAFFSVLRLDFKQAFYYHPLFPAVPLVGLMVIFRKKIPKWLFWTLVVLTLAAYLFVFWYRLVYSDHVVVYVDLKEGLFFKLMGL